MVIEIHILGNFQGRVRLPAHGDVEGLLGLVHRVALGDQGDAVIPQVDPGAEDIHLGDGADLEHLLTAVEVILAPLNRERIDL